MTPAPTPSQRRTLRFCKAFFEVNDLEDTRRLLAVHEIEPLSAASVPQRAGCTWYLWETAPGEVEPGGAVFWLRLFRNRLVLEGPDPRALGRGWRRLAEIVEGAATPRVAAGDDLARFLPRPRRRSADRPETLSKEEQETILREFYAAFHGRWIEQPQAALGGLSPRQAMERPELREIVEELLARLERIEEQRRKRGQASFSVDRLRQLLAR